MSVLLLPGSDQQASPVTIDGLDPGDSGAAVRLRGHGRDIRVTHASYWRTVTRGFRVDDWAEGTKTTRSSVLDREWVVEQFWAEPPAALVAEGVYVGRSANTSLKLQGFLHSILSGCKLNWAARDARPPLREIKESRWRKTMGVPPSSRDREDCVPAMMLRLIPNLFEVVQSIGGEPHIYDAAALALLGMRLRAWDDQWDLRIAGPKAVRVGRRKRRARG